MRKPNLRSALLALAAAAAFALSGCAAGGAAPETAAPTGTGAGDTQAAPTELVVFAAASLTDVFGQIADDFMAEHPGVTVTFNFGGSSGLVTQLQEGARADVLATANEKTMQDAIAAGLVPETTQVFATNVLTIVTEAGNPTGITGLKDLADGGHSLVICAEQVPCGAATKKLEESTGIDLQPVSEENAVTDVLGKVESGQADAGIVYVTDAKGAGDKVTTIELPEAADIVNRYPLSVTANSEHTDLAQAWVDYVLGAHAQELLAAAGFGPAEPRA